MALSPDGLIRRGRNLLVAQFAYLAISSVGLFLWRVEGHPSHCGLTDVLQFAFEFALFFVVWRGWRWAKWLMVALCSAAAVAAALIARRGIHPEEMRVVVIALALFYAWIAVSLVSSRSINAFLNRDRFAGSSR
jgi:hypothetical protein